MGLSGFEPFQGITDDRSREVDAFQCTVFTLPPAQINDGCLTDVVFVVDVTSDQVLQGQVACDLVTMECTLLIVALDIFSPCLSVFLAGEEVFVIRSFPCSSRMRARQAYPPARGTFVTVAMLTTSIVKVLLVPDLVPDR